jgi:hypothetical protein
MKRLILTVLITIICSIILAQTPDWLWATRAGSSNGSNDTGRSVTIDNQGNHYITGEFSGTATFGTTTLTCNGTSDIFVAKLDTNGNWLWAVNGGTGTIAGLGSGIAVDDSSNIYVTGSYNGTANFGTSQLVSSNYNNVFVAKLDSDGNWLWAVQTLGTDNSSSLDIALDNANNIYVTGGFNGVASFGALPPLDYEGLGKLFIAKLDALGNWLWVKQSNGINSNSAGFSITLDDSGYIYLTGGFYGSANFGAIHYYSSGGLADSFVAKLDSSGNWLWVSKTDGFDGDVGHSITIDVFNNIYITGMFMGTITFGNTAVVSIGGYDFYIAKLDTSGNFLWVTSTGGLSWDNGVGISVDNLGNLYVTGYFQGSVNFGTTILASNGFNDIWVAKLNSSGNWLWAKSLGGFGYEHTNEIASDRFGNVSITGYFGSTSGIGPDSLIFNGTGSIFVAKLNSGIVEIEDDVIPACENLSILYNAYPNPFHKGETVQIKSDIADRETGTLSVYNLKGQCITSYTHATGSHQISLDSSKLASGVYLYRLKTQSTDITKKLVLLK